MSTSTSTVSINATFSSITVPLNVRTPIREIYVTNTVVGITDLYSIFMSVDEGSLAVAQTSQNTVTISGNNSSNLSFTSSLSKINSLLATLTYTGNVLGSSWGEIQVQVFNYDLMSLEFDNAQMQINVTPSAKPAVSTGPTASVAQGSTTTVSGVAVNPGAVTLSDQVSSAGVAGIFTVTVAGRLGILSDVPVGAATVTGSGSHSISVTGNLSDVNATLSALKYTASSIGQDVLSMTASVAGTSATSVGTKTINVGVLNSAIENTPKNHAIDLFYQALFNRLANADGLAFWASSNASIGQIANAFMQSSEFTSAYGTKVPNAFFVNKMYSNILGRPADVAGSAYWKGQLDAGASQAAVLVGIATSAESQLAIASDSNQGFLVT